MFLFKILSFLLFIVSSIALDRKTRQSEGECGLPTIVPEAPLSTDTMDFQGWRHYSSRETARPHSWPWAVYLKVCKGLNDCKACGGCLISPTKVLTVAHCVDFGQIKESKIKVYLGMHDLGNEDDGQMRNVSKIFAYSNLTNDFAILTLSQPATISDYISPICIPSTSLKSGTVCYIVGWGKTSNDGKESQVLKQAPLQLVEKTVCSVQIRNSISESQLCAFSSKKNVSACDGDGGSPLQCKVNGYWQVHGLASYRVGSCGNKPQVYANVFHFNKELKDELYGAET